MQDSETECPCACTCCLDCVDCSPTPVHDCPYCECDNELVEDDGDDEGE